MQITVDQIRTTLEQALATGKPGVPVSVRVHCELSEPLADPAVLIPQLLELVQPAFDHTDSSVQCRSTQDTSSWNILLVSKNGRTLFLSLAGNVSWNPKLHFTVIGNHGILRLQSSDCDFDMTSLETSDEKHPGIVRWRDVLDAGMRSGRRQEFSV
ncbi:MAG: hypothetical protein Tsb009_35460 [Planctomycetaceae bacterium]